MSLLAAIVLAREWEGYRVAGAKILELSAGSRCIEIELAPHGMQPLICAGCGCASNRIHETIKRRVRDLPILDFQTLLIVPRRRLLCPRCGPSLELLSWLDRHSRVTRRRAENVARLCAVLPVKHVATFFRLSWDQAKEIYKRTLEQRLGTVDLSAVEVIGVDEFALHKGYRYATVVVEPYRKEALWIDKGRSRESSGHSSNCPGLTAGCKRPKAVVMDMNAPYAEEIKEHSRQAKIVYDLFHVVAKYGREVIDRVRVDEANRLRHDQKARKVVKTARWLLLKNRENVKGNDLLRLQELLEAKTATS